MSLQVRLCVSLNVLSVKDHCTVYFQCIAVILLSGHTNTCLEKNETVAFIRNKVMSAAKEVQYAM